MELYVILGLITIIGVVEILHYKERKELYNRIMAKDLTDFKQSTSTVKVGKCKSVIERNLQNYLNNSNQSD